MADGSSTATMRFFAAARLATATFAFAAAAVMAMFVTASPALAGAGDNVTGWAWSGSIGWISLNCTNQASCATADYGVTLVDAAGARADLRGYAWSETVGWICFGTTCTGPTPEGGATYAQYRATNNGKDNQIWGWAKIVALGDNGWISLNCDHDVGTDDCVASNHSVMINPPTGNFTAGGATDHWGWGMSNEGIGAGWVDFSIVTTTWVLSNLGTVVRPEGVFEPTATGLVGTHRFQFPIVFNNFSGGAGQLLECEILIPDGSKRVIGKTLPASIRLGTTTLTYDLQTADLVRQDRLWYISACRIASSTLGSACANDAACGANAICDEAPVGSGKCRAVVQESTSRRPIYTHGNAWTGLNSSVSTACASDAACPANSVCDLTIGQCRASQDQYSAIKCNAGFPDNYFKNSARCDYTADASFSLAMRRGIPVEGECGDLIDNDGNGQMDCADRYCKGISYRCQQLPRTSCVWGATGDSMNDCTQTGYVNGDLCCTKQPRADNPAQNSVVDGLECTYQDPGDGYYDCNQSGYTSGDLCCSTASVVTKM